jgi:hypothetical protein
MAEDRLPRITINGHDGSCETIATLPSNPDDGLMVYVRSVKQYAVYDADAAAWYAVGPIKNAGNPANGASSPGVGILYVGALCIDTVTGAMLQNIGSATVPVWSQISTAYSTVT